MGNTREKTDDKPDPQANTAAGSLAARIQARLIRAGLAEADEPATDSIVNDGRDAHAPAASGGTLTHDEIRRQRFDPNCWESIKARVMYFDRLVQEFNRFIDAGCAADELYMSFSPDGPDGDRIFRRPMVGPISDDEGQP